MSELVCLVEGPTEQKFVTDQLAVHLGYQQIIAWPVLPGRVHKRGGVRSWESTRGDILRYLKSGKYCTTMFDYYAMPHDWPGRRDAVGQPWGQAGLLIQQKLLDDVAAYAGSDFRKELFIPYVQMHEFEALLFSDVKELAGVTAPLCRMAKDALVMHFDGVLKKAGAPEAINDGYETCPSRRITGVVNAYRKPVYGPIVTSRIGLEAIRKSCTHFDSWLKRLEMLS